MFSEKHTVAVFFDLSKTYIITSKRRILNKLQTSQPRGPIPAFIRNFLSNQNNRVKVEKTYYEEDNLVDGVPQS